MKTNRQQRNMRRAGNILARMLVVLTAWTSLTTLATELYVSPEGDGSGGTSWSTAYTNVQDALDAAVSNDTVYLAGRTFALTNQVAWTNSGVTVRGGYEADPAKASPGAQDAAQWPTVLTRAGANNHRILLMDGAHGSHLNQVTIDNGYVTASGQHGGGIAVVNTASVQLDSLILRGNRAGAGSASGGGLYLAGSDVIVTNTVIEDNLARSSGWSNPGYGGGLYVASGTLRLTDSWITNNTAHANQQGGSSGLTGAHGGGVFVAGSATATIERCVLAHNYVGLAWSVDSRNSFGGGLYSSGTTTLRNVIVHDNNTYHQNSDGVHAAGGALWLENCTIANNAGVGLRRDGGDLTALNSIVWGHENQDTWGIMALLQSNIQDGSGAAGDGCLSVEPQFVDEEFFHLESRAGHYAAGYFTGGYWTNSLTTNSPLIDAVSENWDNEPHPNGRARNMGAYGNTPVASKTFLMEPGIFSELTVIAYPSEAIDASTADLYAEVLHTGEAEDPRMVFCWGTADGGTSGTNAWQQAVDLGTREQWELVSFQVTGLTSGQKYFFRCFVSNSTGTAWSDPIQPFASIELPTIENTGPGYVRRHEAGLRGQVVETGEQVPTIWISFWQEGGSVTNGFSLGTQEGVFEQEVAGLSADTEYAYFVTASNAAGTVESVTQSFRTAGASMQWYAAPGGTSRSATNWTSAFSDPQRALDALENGDTLHVAGGLFQTVAQLNWGGVSNVTILGGYEAASDLVLPGPRDPAAWPSVMERDETIADFRILEIDALTNAVIDGLTFQNGLLTVSGEQQGAGLRIVDSPGLTFVSCIVRDNTCGSGGHGRGAGMYVANSSLSLSNCLFTVNLSRGPGGNGTGHGGGLYLADGATAIVNRSTFSDNIAQGTQHNNQGFGGGVYIAAGATLDVRESRFEGNQGLQGWNGDDGRGGAFYSIGDTTMLNVLLVKNKADHSGAAFYTAGGSTVLRNVTLSDNVAIPNGDLQISTIAVPGGTAAITNAILWGNATDLDVAGDVAMAYALVSSTNEESHVGCFIADPLFVDTTYYHLQSIRGNYIGGSFEGGTWAESEQHSPAIDRGDPAADWRLEPTPAGRRVNLGAYGNTPVASMADTPLGTLFILR